MPRFLLMLGLLCSLIGCGHVRPMPPTGCAVPAYRLLPSPLDPRGLAQPDPAAPMDLGRVLADSLSKGREGGFGASQRVLLLSGGSQHGSFGAGLFTGMAQVPDYQVVTGVSTGALQSTFVFLANRPAPADRTYPDYMKRQGGFGTPGTSNLTDLALAYRIEREGDLMKVGPLGLVGAAFKGSAADFGPLRAALLGLISPDTIRAVAAEAAMDRKLLVGAANVDDGYGYAADLTLLAQQAVASGNIDAARHCFVEALIASSSVPPGVPPVSLSFATLRSDGGAEAPATDMFIDGGARYGVFFSQLHDAVAADGGTDLDLVVNGFLYGKPWRDKDGGRVEKWNAASLALRAVDLMENQVYRLSIGEAQRWAVEHGTLRMAFLSDEGLDVLPTPPLDWSYQGKTCAEWKAADAAQFKPMEFYPNYMKCLVDYGEHRGAADPWNKLVPPSATDP